MRTGEAVRRTAGGTSFQLLDLETPWQPEQRCPVLLQHGLGLDHTAWHPWARAMLPDRPVISVDLRGHGGSTRNPPADSFDLADVAGDVLAVLDECEVETCHYVGESFGGTLGLFLAGTQGHRFVSVTACSTGWKGAWFHHLRGWEALLAAGGIAAWSREMIEARFDPEAVEPGLVEWVDELQQRVRPDVVAAIADCLLDADLEALLGGITVPVLMMLGDSPFVDERNVDGLLERVPGAQAVRIPGARHGIVLSHRAECLAAASAFMARTERALRPE